MKIATAVALVWLGGILVVCGGQDPQGGGASATPPASGYKPPSGDGGPIAQDKVVVITVKGTSLEVVSNDALIHVGQPLSWELRGVQAGQSVEIDFEVYHSTYRDADRYVKGPFGLRERPSNPVRGRFFLDEKNRSVASGPSDTPGYFKYHVVLRRGTEDIAALDPGVVVKNDF